MLPPPEEDVSLYDYELPPESIAQSPLSLRSASRLMVLTGGSGLQHHIFSDLPKLLRRGDLLVRNTTKVFPARLRGRRSGSGKTELLLIRCVAPLTWECLARPASHLKPGKPVYFGSNDELVATVEEKHKGGHIIVSFKPGSGEIESSIPEQEAWFWNTLSELGETPLPPYIQRPDGPDASDEERYQTVFARTVGAVAAPTAGLHFTDELFAELDKIGVGVTDLVLHVGPGTFRPIKTAQIDQHKMDVEFYDIPLATIDRIHQTREQGGRVIAVGTTVTRALESAAEDSGFIRAGDDSSGLFIRPPYNFKVINGLITNFHLPRSTLLMLVSALIGRERLMAAYREAIESGYRFYSYGDAMLLLP